MYIITMHLKISFVPNRVFPKPPLPYKTFPLSQPRSRRVGIAHQKRPHPFRKPSLNHPPPLRIITIAIRQCPYAVYVVRHQNPGVNIEGPGGLHFLNHFPKGYPALLPTEDLCPVVSNDSKKPGSSLFRPAIIRHYIIFRRVGSAHHGLLLSFTVGSAHPTCSKSVSF